MKRIALKNLLPRMFRRRSESPYSAGATTEARRRRLRRLLGVAQPTHASLTLDPARATLFVVTVALLSLLLCIHLWPNRVSLKLGEVANRDIMAQRTVSYEDTDATQQLRDFRALQVGKQYDPNPDANVQALDNLRAIFDGLDGVSHSLDVSSPTIKPGTANRPPAPPTSAPPTPGADQTALLRGAVINIHQRSGVILPPGTIATLARANAGDREQARGVAMNLVERIMGHVIPDDSDDLTTFRHAATNDPLLVKTAPGLREATGTVVAAVLLPNEKFDPRVTDQKRRAAASEVPPTLVRLRAGTTVIHAGDHVTQQHLDEFKALGLQTERLDAVRVIVICVLVLLLVSIATLYLRLFHQDLYGSNSRMLLLAILTVLSVVGLKIGSTLLTIPVRDIQLGLGYLGMMSVASAGMAIALLLSPRAALLIVALLSVASGLILNNELRFTVITMASSLTGIVSVSSIRNRGDLLRAGLILCGANALFTVLVGQMEGDLPPELLSGMLWGVFAGGAAILLFLLTVAVFEKPFGITTHLRLLELSDPATAVLQEFRLRAPGTYAHSLMVGNIAHAAAVAIDADGLLVRVAAYYHDLGKMNRPEFFIENQSNVDNIHDRLNPSLSAIILGSHVKEGLEMISALGIPPRVWELVQQHHGTSLMKFFYDRATEGGGASDPGLESRFRYPGPRPQTREAAILMLADTIEAASRVLSRPTPSRISDFVREKIENIRADGQLDESDLTLRELKTIHDSFVRTLSGTMHARIVYPEDRTAAAAARVMAAPPAVELSPMPSAPTSGEVETVYADESAYADAPDAATVADALSRLGAPPPEETIPQPDGGDNRTNAAGDKRTGRLGARRPGGPKPARRER